MPFVESAESLRAKTHTSNVNPAVLVGILVLLGAAAVFFTFNVLDAASGADFQLSSSSSDSGLDLSSSGQTSSLAESLSSSADEQVLSCKDTQAHATEESQASSDVFVFVSGSVVNPGVYRLDWGGRVVDAVQAAGGFAEGAATSYNNLARVCVDGEQIHVPSIEEAQDTPVGSTTANTSTPDLSSTHTEDTAQGLVNINTATQEELETLPGIGPSTASKILVSRETEGPFASVDEIMRVSGIGQKKYESIEGLICV